MFQKVLPVLETMGRTSCWRRPGAGQHTKMANQIAIAGRWQVCEALTYAKRAGLDPARPMRPSVPERPERPVDIIAPKVLNGDFSAAFYLRHL